MKKKDIKTKWENGKIAGLDMMLLTGIGFAGWVYLVCLFRKENKKWEVENN